MDKKKFIKKKNYIDRNLLGFKKAKKWCCRTNYVNQQ